MSLEAGDELGVAAEAGMANANGGNAQAAEGGSGVVADREDGSRAQPLDQPNEQRRARDSFGARVATVGEWVAGLVGMKGEDVP